VPGCSQVLFVPMRENMRFLCLPSNDLRVITNGTKTIASSMALPLASEAQNRDTPEYAVGGVASANGRSVYIATDTGRIWNTDDSLSQITRTIDLGLPAEMGAALGALAISPDGATLYIGIGQRDSQSVLVPADRIAIVDTASGKQIGTITLSQLFRSFTISADGHYLYAIARDRQSVFVIDTTTQRQVDVIKEVGTPIRFIAVAP
jgi:DNA-binding beta-propeller fold protein YncE